MGSAYDIPFWSKHFYDHKARWIHYFNQVQAVASEIRNRKEDIKNFKILEVGPSHGFVTSYLRKFGVDVTTIDNKKEYDPDVLGSVFEMPFENDSFDMILCCEVLEHTPYDLLSQALNELRRVTKKKVLFSVPDGRRTLFSLDLKIPFLKKKQVLIKIPTFKKHKMEQKGGHCWEIGKKEYPLNRIIKEIKKTGFNILKENVFIDTPKNYYFLLNK